VAELAAHARHDPVRVAGSVDRGASRAPMLDLCARCAALYADLVLLAAALPLAALPARPRDFRLTVAEARHLRVRRWGSWWASVGSARDSLTRPLAIGFTTLGLVGLLVTGLSEVLPMVGSSAGSSSAASMPLDYRALATLPADREVTAIGADHAAPPPDVALTAVVEHRDAVSTVSAGLVALGIGLFAARQIAAGGRRVR
jgi:hypothetical protein